MAGFDAETDIREWNRAVVALERRLVAATEVATNRGMWLIDREVKRYLRTYSHRRGTPTPSPPGGPPALVSGHLRRSWRTVPAHAGRRPHTIEAEGGPTAAYARIHELGGEIVQVRSRRVKRRGGGESVETYQVQIRIPRRPYVRPMLLVLRREIRRGYIDQWRIAIRGG